MRQMEESEYIPRCILLIFVARLKQMLIP